MKVYGVPEDRAIGIVLRVSRDLYGGNITVRDSRATSGRSCSLSLRARSSRKYGARFAASGRHSIAASWEAYRDVIRALFDAGATHVRTAVTDYHPATFEDEYPATYWHNVGSMMYPACIGDLSLGRDW